jgi:hypothetical protein
MVADEHHQQAVRSTALFQRPDVTIGAGKREVNCRRAKVAEWGLE